jgi:branched-chain amino acid transport system substrate-binding protein
MSQVHRNFLVSGAQRLPLALLAALLLLGGSSGCSPPDPVRIGYVGGISGRVADLGITGRDGVQLAVERINQAGGVSGHPVEIISRDDHQDPAAARRVVEELIELGVSAIVGPMTSAMGVAVAPIVNEHKVLMVSPTVTTEELSGLDDYFFRVSSTTGYFSTRNAKYQLSQKKLRRMAAIYDLGNRSFSVNWLQNFRRTFVAGGGEMVTEVSFVSGGDEKYIELARRALTSGPDGVLIIANSVDSALLCQQIRKLDSMVPITLADWGATERLLELGGRAVEGVTVIQTFDRASNNPRYKEFRQAYLLRFNREPGFAGVYAFESTNVILKALERMEQGKDLKQVLLDIPEFEGLQSSFRFDRFGDVTRPHASISIVENGQFVVKD